MRSDADFLSDLDLREIFGPPSAAAAAAGAAAAAAATVTQPPSAAKRSLSFSRIHNRKAALSSSTFAATARSSSSSTSFIARDDDVEIRPDSLVLIQRQIREYKAKEERDKAARVLGAFGCGPGGDGNRHTETTALPAETNTNNNNNNNNNTNNNNNLRVDVVASTAKLVDRSAGEQEGRRIVPKSPKLSRARSYEVPLPPTRGYEDDTRVRQEFIAVSRSGSADGATTSTKSTTAKMPQLIRQQRAPVYSEHTANPEQPGRRPTVPPSLFVAVNLIV
ncbi:hypothetical protein HDU82_001887, partial [Entophlyctis luteolus]